MLNDIDKQEQIPIQMETNTSSGVLLFEPDNEITENIPGKCILLMYILIIHVLFIIL